MSHQILNLIKIKRRGHRGRRVGADSVCHNLLVKIQRKGAKMRFKWTSPKGAKDVKPQSSFSGASK